MVTLYMYSDVSLKTVLRHLLGLEESCLYVGGILRLQLVYGAILRKSIHFSNLIDT